MSTEGMEQAADYATPAGMAQRWERELQAAMKEKKKFDEASRKIVRDYLDQRDEYAGGASRINLFWSNVQVLKSTLYAKPPKVDVSRLFKDDADDVARVAGEMLERLLNNDIEQDGSPFDMAARQGIEDWLIVGMGQMWLRYEVATATAQTEEVRDQMTGQVLVESQQYEVIEHEDAVSEYVFWGDFLWSPARTWQEVRWVARRVYMGRDALVERFGEKIGRDVPLGDKKQDGGPQNNPWRRAEVWEVWCKETRKVYWHVIGMGYILDAKDDPLQLTDFYPCPMPVMANLTTSNLMPRADYALAQDLYQQINEAQTRLKYLIRACKHVGIYDKSEPSIQSLYKDGVETYLVPVDNWAMFAERGGVQGAMAFAPVAEIGNVIGRLREDIAMLKNELYEVMGIADIMRGASQAQETATAQQIKAQYGSTRLQFKQFEVARWVRDALRIKAEIICRHFQPQTIMQRSNIERTPDAQMAPQAADFLKEEGTLSYRVQVEADSMAAMDWAAERDARTQFLTAVGGFVQSTMPLLQASPQSAPLLLQLLQWGLGGFRVGKQIEGVLDQAIQQLQQQPMGPQGPSPKDEAEVRKINADADRSEADAQVKRASLPSPLFDTGMAMQGGVPPADMNPMMR